ncbi:MAG: hypothetical protein EOO61_19175 [Hymenobacter sp.]|nr:MAG: hypothetical protein EOO61_19175 [Hymenobacter sp.]
MYTLFTITAHHISQLRGVSYGTARKEWHQVKDALALTGKMPLKLRDLAGYWDICPKELAESLYLIRK